jgi:hypothetical protein
MSDSSQFQRLAAGDKVLGTPYGKITFPVARVEAGRALVLGGTVNTCVGSPVIQTI